MPGELILEQKTLTRNVPNKQGGIMSLRFKIIIWKAQEVPQ